MKRRNGVVYNTMPGCCLWWISGGVFEMMILLVILCPTKEVAAFEVITWGGTRKNSRAISHSRELVATTWQPRKIAIPPRQQLQQIQQKQGGVSLSAFPPLCRKHFLQTVIATPFIWIIPSSEIAHADATTHNSMLQAKTTTMTLGQSSIVQEGQPRMVLSSRPKAPTGALIPAMQQRLLLEKCLALSQESIKVKDGGDDDKEKKDKLLQQIKLILLNIDDTSRSNTSTNLNKINNKNNKDLNIMLQYEPSKVLSGSIVRAAMNIYTANLRYGDEPQYTVTDPDWKTKYIRANDGLPDVNKVIVADLDMRDLVRNQVQLKLDDASAELYSSQEPDEMELFQLLQEAANAYDEWLDKISHADIRDTIQAIQQGKSLHVYEPYYQGFLPPK